MECSGQRLAADYRTATVLAFERRAAAVGCGAGGGVGSVAGASVEAGSTPLQP
jgi:hypothetical protein